MKKLFTLALFALSFSGLLGNAAFADNSDQASKNAASKDSHLIILAEDAAAKCRNDCLYTQNQCHDKALQNNQYIRQAAKKDIEECDLNYRACVLSCK